MAEYRIGCGAFGIYAGVLKKNGIEWLHKTNVTNDAIGAVAEYMYKDIPDGKKTLAYGFRMRDGKFAELRIVQCDECPELARDGEQNGTD